MEGNKHNTAIQVGGWAMILFSILFVGTTFIIDQLAQTQIMLYSLKQHRLFEVVAGTPTIQFLLIFYALLPLLLIPGAVGTYYAFKEHYAANLRIAMYFTTIGVAALCVSLLMLPSLNWYLVTYISALPTQQQPSMIIILQALHCYLGIYVGDILGLGSLLVWFFITSLVMLYSRLVSMVLGVILLILAICAAIILTLWVIDYLPAIYSNVQVPGIVALWVFICGMGLLSVHKKHKRL